MADQAALKAGWTDAGGGMVKNAAGQLTYAGSQQYNDSNYDGAPAAGAQGGGAQTGGSNPYDPNSGAAATQSTVSQSDQGTLRNALISQMTQNPVPDANDPTIARQVAPYRAAMDRQVNQQVRGEAEQAFGSGQDYGSPERMAAAERAGQQSGLMESQLVGREIQSRRDQIQQALGQFGNMLSGDQQRALQKQLADLDAQLRREGYATQTALGNADIGLRKELGYGGLNNQLLGMLFQNGQFNTNMGRLFGLDEANLNRDALLSAWG